MPLTAATVFRDYVTDGVPSSGIWNPQKADIRNLLAGIYANTYLNVTTNYTVLTGDAGAAIVATGTASGTVTFGAASGYTATHFNIFWNKSSRIWFVAPNGISPTVRVWPGNCVLVANLNNAWGASAVPRYRNPSAGVILTVDYINGSDAIGDGLVTGTGAIKTVYAARTRIVQDVDCAGIPPTIQLTAGQTQLVGGGVNLIYVLTGAAQLYIQGDSDAANNYPNRGSYGVQCDAGTNCFFAREPSTTTLVGMTLQSADGHGTGAAATQFSTLDLLGVDFKQFDFGWSCDNASVNFLPGSMVGRTYDYKILGNQNVGHGSVSNTGVANFGSLIVNIPNALAFSYFVAVSTGGRITAGGVANVYTGAGAGGGSTGQRYNVTPPGMLDTGGATNPGNAPGVVNPAVYFS